MLNKITKTCIQHMAIIKGKLINKNVNNRLQIAKFLNIPVNKSQLQESQSHSDPSINTKIHSNNANLKNLSSDGKNSSNSNLRGQLEPMTSIDKLIQMRYMIFLQNNELATIQVSLFHKKNKQLKIIDFTKNCISRSQKLTKQVQNGIKNFVTYCISIFRYQTQYYKNKPIYDHNQFIDYFIVINQLFVLVQLNESFLMDYMNMLVYQSKFIRYVGVHIYIQNYRICLDFMMKILLEKQKQGRKNLKSLLIIMRLISIISVKNLYYQKSNQIISLMQKQVRILWYQDQFLLKFLTSFEKIGFYNQRMVNKMFYILQKPNTSKIFKQKFIIFNILLNIGKITNKNYKKHEKILIQVLEITCNNKIQLISSAFKMMMAQIWIEQYWNKFFDYMDNHFVEANFHLIYVLSRIFEMKKQQIPSMIYQRGLQTIKTILSNQRDLSKQKILTDFHTKQNMNISLACQIQIANMLRLVNVGSVRTECIIDIFSVDILVNNQFVIEINGGMHYLLNLDTNINEPNLKTRFRTQYLMKIGYKVINIDLSQYNEGSFQIIKMIYEIILKESGSKQAKNFQLPSMSLK